jgi:hypothetical protein
LRVPSCLCMIELLYLLSTWFSELISWVGLCCSQALLKMFKTKNEMSNDWDRLQYPSPSCVTTSLLSSWISFHSYSWFHAQFCFSLSSSCFRLVVSFIRPSLWPPNL